MRAHDFYNKIRPQDYPNAHQANRIRIAAQELIDRWDSPQWNGALPDIVVLINRLRKVMEETK